MNRFKNIYYNFLNEYVDILPIENITAEDMQYIREIKNLCQDIIFEKMTEKIVYNELNQK